jgi:hypothetical protein
MTITINTENLDALQVVKRTLDSLADWGWDEVTDAAYEHMDDADTDPYPWDGDDDAKDACDAREEERDGKAETLANAAKEILDGLREQLNEIVEREEATSLPSPSTSVSQVIL